ncbi:MAG: hypothetical protein ACHQ9S_06710 [Candidatus Binatia bacterium]
MLAAPRPARAGSFVEFESGLVRPLALSPDGTTLFAVNTPDNRLEIFSVGPPLTHRGSVVVGMEPVAVAARTNTEVWVVNHLSDSISIVDVSTGQPRVINTLLVGDEPRDIVFAGPGRHRAFITTAHRGQHLVAQGIDPQLTTPGVGRADVWVFDAAALGSGLGGAPLTIVTLFADTPRALAVSNDGNTVYAAAFHSGNQTATVTAGVVCANGSDADHTLPPCTVDGVTYPGGVPAPNVDADGVTGPNTGLIAKFNGTHWVDHACAAGTNRGEPCATNADCPGSSCGRQWDNAIRFSLPDRDVFSIDAGATPPVEITAGEFASVGTILFNMAVNPSSGKIYVSNTEAKNDVRFEGNGSGGSTVQGHLHEARITVLDPSGPSVTPRHLNKHIDYRIRPAPAGTSANSLATPTGMSVTSDGATLYVAAFGSSQVGVFNTTQLENDTFVPDGANYIAVSGGGPSGVVLDEPNHRLYVLTRFDNGVSVVNTLTNAEVDHQHLFTVEPAGVVAGRPFLYDANLTSSNGEASCSSCHVFGDFDSLAWDLGVPENTVLHNPNPFRIPAIIDPDFHSLKGPMTTQTLRGMINNGPMHWRGDRTAGNDPGGNPLDANGAFLKFNVAFTSLVGRATQLTPAQMQQFATFILQVTLPPNPNRALDNSLTAAQQAGRDFFMGSVPTDTLQPCHGCHALDPANGHFGTDGFSSFENETQDLKIPHLRNLYQKVGMFGMPSVSDFINPGNNGPQGPQVRGFGFLHDGSVDTMFRFHNATVFNQSGLNPGGFPSGAAGNTQRRNVEQFMLAFDSDMKPAMGQEITLNSGNASTVGPRIDLLIARAQAGDCDLVVKGNAAGLQRGWYRQSDGMFRSDRASEPLLGDVQLRALATTPGQELTYLCVSPGAGVRVGVDRDEDGCFDRDELDAGTDPANPLSYPGACTATPPPSPAVTASPTYTMLRTATPTNGPTASVTPTATTVHVACIGDCNHSGTVTVDELITGANIALGTVPLDQCPAFDCNGNGHVTVDCLLTAVNAALNGCPTSNAASVFAHRDTSETKDGVLPVSNNSTRARTGLLGPHGFARMFRR